MRLIILVPFLSACVVTSARPGADPVHAADPAPAVPIPVADPAPASAHRDSFDNLVGPGGSPSGTPATCDAAHDHCLRPDTWFVSEWEGGDAGWAVPAFRFEETLWRWTSRHDQAYGRGHRTEPATARTLAVGAGVVVYGDGALPRHEDDALTAEWTIGIVEEIDGVTLRVAGRDGWIPLAVTRVILESR